MAQVKARTPRTTKTPEKTANSSSAADPNVRDQTLNALVDIMQSDFDKFRGGKAATRLKRGGKAATRLKRGGSSPSNYVQVRDDGVVLTNDVKRLIKMGVAITVVLLWVGIFSPKTTFAVFKYCIMWVFRRLKMVTSIAMRLVNNFIHVMYAILKVFWRNLQGRKFLTAFTVSGLVYGLNWLKVGKAVVGFSGMVHTQLASMYYKVLNMIDDHVLQPIYRLIVLPNQQLAEDLHINTIGLSQWFTNLNSKIASVLNGT